VGAIGIEGVDPDFLGFGGEEESSVAVLATDCLADVLAIDSKLTAAIGTLDEIPPGSEFDHTSKLLQFEERGDLDAVGFEVGIQHSSAGNAPNQVLGHVLTAIGTWSAGPNGHGIVLRREMWIGTSDRWRQGKITPRPIAIDTGRNHARKIVPVSRLPVGHIVEVQGNEIE